MTNYKIYTDGSSTGKVGDGGWGFAVYLDDEEIYASYGSAKQTTNNRMELSAAIEGLRWAVANDLEHHQVEIYSDSQYVVNGTTVWRQSFENKSKIANKLINCDLWIELYNLIDFFTTIDFIWVKGHSGNKLNDRVDSLAKTGKLLAKDNDPNNLRDDS